MKVNTKIILTTKLVLAFVSILVFLTVFGCQDNSDNDDITPQIIGTWHQKSNAVDGVTVAIDSVRLAMQISANNICILCDSSYAAVTSKKIIRRSGWSYGNGLLNIALDLPASWTVTTSANRLIMERIDFGQNGVIVKTALTYERIPDIKF